MNRLYSITLFIATLFAFCPSAVLSQDEAADIDLSAYILTPKAPETPRINCSKIFGVRPGSAFQFYVATTGKHPITFSAENLPKGLKLNSKTGIITGKLKVRGVYRVTLHAKNSLGSDSRNFRIVVGDEIALTPPMGWNSWNCWGNRVSQEKVMMSAQAMVNCGLIDYGWTYINIDDGWQGIRGGKYNSTQPNKKFPDMKKLVDQIHSMGLKAGIYDGPWVGTYAGHIGTMCDNEDGTYEWVKQGKHNENYKYVVANDPEGNTRLRVIERPREVSL